jgi:hypothetical protein
MDMTFLGYIIDVKSDIGRVFQGPERVPPPIE